MKEDSAPGPNGFTATFFKVFWDCVKEDILEMFHDLHAGKLDLKDSIMG